MKKHLLVIFIFLSTTSYSQVARGSKAFPVIGETIGHLDSAVGHIIDDIGVWHLHRNSIAVTDSFRIADVIEYGDEYVFGRYIDKMYKFSKKPGFEGNVNVYLFNEKEYQKLKEKYDKSRFELKEVIDFFEFYKFQNIKVNKKNYVLFTIKSGSNCTKWFLITDKEFQKLENINYDTVNRIELKTVCDDYNYDLGSKQANKGWIKHGDIRHSIQEKINDIPRMVHEYGTDLAKILSFHFLLNKETQKVRFLIYSYFSDNSGLSLSDDFTCHLCGKIADSEDTENIGFLSPGETPNFDNLFKSIYYETSFDNFKKLMP